MTYTSLAYMWSKACTVPYNLLALLVLSIHTVILEWMRTQQTRDIKPALVQCRV